MAATNTDRFILLTDNDVQNFLEAEENQNMFKKNQKVTYLALVMAFLAAGNENWQLKDVQLDTLYVCCAHSWAINLNAWREIPYLHMYKSLYVL